MKGPILFIFAVHLLGFGNELAMLYGLVLHVDTMVPFGVVVAIVNMRVKLSFVDKQLRNFIRWLSGH